MSREDTKEKIATLLSDIYCDDCKFNLENTNYWIEKVGYWGCEDCNRKCMGWEPSDRCLDDIVDILDRKE